MINKNTKVCISIAESAGNFGCSIHNAAFKKVGCDFIYKSFSVKKSELNSAIKGIKAFGIRGCGVTMPYKISAINFVDKISEEVGVIGSCNTIINDDGVLTAYNTDAYSTYTVLSKIKHRDIIYILGSGGFSKAAQFSAKKLFDEVKIITRNNWEEIGNIDSGLIFNCTPVENITVNPNVCFIDCLINTQTGKELSLLQASKQFHMYTGIKFPMEYVKKNLEEILI